MLYLKCLNLKDSKQEFDFFKNMKSENGFMNDYENISYEDFINTVLPTRFKYSQGIDLPQNHVPDTYFFLWDDNKIVGLFKIRHYLNDALKNGSGHIGYGILKDYRQQGYASQGLALAIQECQKLMPSHETEIYMSCYKHNLASLKTMLKNNAYIHHEDEDHYYTRIKIR